MKKCTCKIITRQDFMDDWIARCISHVGHRQLSSISTVEKTAVKKLKTIIGKTNVTRS